MTRDVLLSISGLQFDASQEDTNIETITAAEYYKRNDSHYLLFDEVVEGFEESTKSVLKFKENQLELTKKGLVNVHMIFEENRKNMTRYHTPYGELMIGIEAEKITLKEEEAHISVQVNYALEINYEHLADCKISVNICPRENVESMLLS